MSLPSVYDLSYEEMAADNLIAEQCPGGIAVNPAIYPPPQYGEAVRATILWLRGETTRPPTVPGGQGPYNLAIR